GKESNYEIFKNDQDFNFFDALFEAMPINRIFTRFSHAKFAQILKDFLRKNLNDLTSRMQQVINEATSICIGECV
ncbi:34537_t:CDS:1, partial [Racocetra persica]